METLSAETLTKLAYSLGMMILVLAGRSEAPNVEGAAGERIRLTARRYSIRIGTPAPTSTSRCGTAE